MQHLGTLAFQRAARGHLLGMRVCSGLENWVGKWYLSLANRPAATAVGYQECLLQYQSCNLEQSHFAGLDDHLLWKFVTCRSCTHLSIPKSHLLLLQLTFPWDVTCLVLMDVCFLVSIRIFWEAGNLAWQGQIWSDYLMPSHHLNIFPCNLLPIVWKRGHTTLCPCACWCWVSHGTHPRRPPAAAEQQSGGGSKRRSLAESSSMAPQPLVGQVLPPQGADSSWPICTKLEDFKLSSCHHSQVCIISFLLLPASLSLAVLVVPVALLLLLALCFISYRCWELPVFFLDLYRSKSYIYLSFISSKACRYFCHQATLGLATYSLVLHI